MSNSTFLDDLLYNQTITHEIDKDVDLITLVNDLHRICANRISTQIPTAKTNKDVKTITDRVFNGWDLFVRRLEKEKHLCAGVMKKYSFKWAFLNDKDMKAIYNKL